MRASAESLVPAIFAKRIIGGFLVFVSLIAGCGTATPQQQLSGHWVGVPNVAGDVVQGLAAMAGNQPPVVKSAAKIFGQLAANTVLKVELYLKPSGTAIVKGNASALGLPSDAVGTWQILSTTGDSFEVAFVFNNKKINSTLILLSPDEIMLKFPKPSESSDQTSGQMQGTTGIELNPNPGEMISVSFNRGKS